MDSMSVPSANRREGSEVRSLRRRRIRMVPPEAYAEFLGLLDYFADVAMKVSRSQTF